jgi:hypothetical protein
MRRTVLPISALTLKIAAIEHRSNFSILKGTGDYIGLELGADIAADLNLDDFLVFDNNQAKSTAFFKTLIYRHYQVSEERRAEVTNADTLIQLAFTQAPVFEEFVRAVEGVPRDALNWLQRSQQRDLVKRSLWHTCGMQHATGTNRISRR